jgi:hypothetical protein
MSDFLQAVRELGRAFCICGHTGREHKPGRYIGQCSKCLCNWFYREKITPRGWFSMIWSQIKGAA